MNALQVAPYMAWYNSVPTLPAHSYLVLDYMLKVLTLYTGFRHIAGAALFSLL
jgi:hypothetical protein